jgi:PGF-pre-PGF domain-containing protein
VVSEVKVTLFENRENIRLSLDSIENLSSKIPEPENLVVYSYFRILSNVPENIIRTTKVVFSVVKAWIEQNVDENTIALYLYREEVDSWEPLETIKTKENETHVFYSAQLEGFSTFAVCGRALRVVPAPPSKEKPAPTPTIASILPFIVIVLILLAFTGFLRMFRKSSVR